LTLYKNSGDSPLADGTAVLASNSALPDAWDADPTLGTGSTCKYQADYIEFVAGAGASDYLVWTGKTGATLAAGWRGEVYLTGYPTAAVTIVNLRTTGGGTSILSVALSSTGLVTATNDVAATQLGQAGNPVPLNGWYDIVVQFDATAGTAAGNLTITVYPNGSGTPVSGAGLTLTGQNLGTNTLGGTRIGKVSAANNLATMRMRHVQFQTGTAAAIAAWQNPPTAAFTSSSSALAASFSASGSSAVSPATITGYAWTFGDGGTGTGVSPSHTYTAAGTYTVNLTVTDSNGATATVSHPVTVSAPASSGAVVSVDAGTSASWTASSGTIMSAITDGDASSWIIVNGAGTYELDVTLPALTPPSNGYPLKVFLGVFADGATSAAVSAQIKEGATTRSSLTAQPIPLSASPTGPVTGAVALSFPWSDVSTITTGGWNGLKCTMQLTVA
jgi:PKD repeat protein